MVSIEAVESVARGREASVGFTSLLHRGQLPSVRAGVHFVLLVFLVRVVAVVLPCRPIERPAQGGVLRGVGSSHERVAKAGEGQHVATELHLYGLCFQEVAQRKARRTNTPPPATLSYRAVGGTLL